MGDSWEDEDFEIPVFNKDADKQNVKNSAVWEDEEEVVEDKPQALTEAQLDAKKKKEEQDAINAQNKAKFAEMAKESVDERKAREKKQMEESDDALSQQLFGTAISGASRATSSSSDAFALAPLRTIQDHQAYAGTVSKKFTQSQSTAFAVGAFYVKLTNLLKRDIPLDAMEEVFEVLKSEIEAQKANVKKPVAPKKSKKEIKKDVKKHEDVFGGDFINEDKYSHLSNMEDDFM